jgi:hypothetical protein
MTEIVPSSMPILVDFGVFLTLGSARLAIPASQWHRLVLPPCHCEAGITSNMWKCHTLDARGGDFDDDGIEGKSVRGGGRSAPVGVSFLSFLHTVLGKTTWNFFWFVQ